MVKGKYSPRMNNDTPAYELPGKYISNHKKEFNDSDSSGKFTGDLLQIMDPYLEKEKEIKRDIKHPTTDFETFIHLLKGNIGTGCLAMPEAFMHAGLWVGLGFIPILGAFCIHCMHMILKCSREICRRGNFTYLSYEETAEMAFKLGPPWAQKWHKVAARIITTFLIITQLGFSCVYIVFVSQNLYQAVTCITGNTTLTQYDYILILVVPLLLCCYIPHLKYITPISLMASVFQLVGTILIFYYFIRDLPHIETKVPAFGSWGGLPLFFGTALFSFEGIGLVLPLENNMKSPNSFPGLTGIMNIGMMLVAILYSSFGFFGYLRYGNTVLGSVTLNLPGDEALAQSIKFMLSFAIFFSYPLQMYVPIHILLPSIGRRFNSKVGKLIAEYSFRTAIVLLTVVLAASIPNIGLFIDLIGAVSSTTLALIFPPIIDIVTFWPKNGSRSFRLYKNIFIVLFGLLGFGTGAYASSKAIIQFFVSGNHSIELGC